MRKVSESGSGRARNFSMHLRLNLYASSEACRTAEEEARALQTLRTLRHWCRALPVAAFDKQVQRLKLLFAHQSQLQSWRTSRALRQHPRKIFDLLVLPAAKIHMLRCTLLAKEARSVTAEREVVLCVLCHRTLQAVEKRFTEILKACLSTAHGGSQDVAPRRL